MAASHGDRQVPHLCEAALHQHERAGLFPAKRAIHHVLLSELWPARNVLASQLRDAHEPRLRELKHPRFAVALQLLLGWHASERALLRKINRQDAESAKGFSVIAA